MKIYRITFYAHTRGEVITKFVEADDVETAMAALLPYMSSSRDVKEIQVDKCFGVINTRI